MSFQSEKKDDHLCALEINQGWRIFEGWGQLGSYCNITGKDRGGVYLAIWIGWGGGTPLTSQSPWRAGRGPTYTLREIQGVPGIAVVLHLQGHNPSRLHEANLMRKRVVSQPSIYLHLSLPLSSHLHCLEETERARHYTMKKVNIRYHQNQRKGTNISPGMYPGLNPGTPSPHTPPPFCLLLASGSTPVYH